MTRRGWVGNAMLGSNGGDAWEGTLGGGPLVKICRWVGNATLGSNEGDTGVGGTFSTGRLSHPIRTASHYTSEPWRGPGQCAKGFVAYLQSVVCCISRDRPAALTTAQGRRWRQDRGRDTAALEGHSTRGPYMVLCVCVYKHSHVPGSLALAQVDHFQRLAARP